MLVRDLIRGLPIEAGGFEEVDILGLAHDSRRVEEGDLFAVFIGERYDARKFVPQALERGARAVLAPTPSPAGYAGAWLVAAEPRAVVGPLAARLYGYPDRDLRTVGVTGTNGKSTVVGLISAILSAAGEPSGRIGTLGYTFEDFSLPAPRTTPEAPDLFRILREMVDRGARAAVMEVSSHALDQGRVAGLSFDLALFTNLTRDHLDFHHDLETYFAVKRRIFGQLKDGGRAVVNVDDPFGTRLAADLDGVVTYGAEGDVRPAEADLTTDGIEARIDTPRGTLQIRSRLVGGYNLENLLAAVAAGVALEVDPLSIRAGLEACGPLPGRMERVGTGALPVFVDFAHTDAALRAALGSLRSLIEGEIVLVFGCGGDRDPGKRELMGRAAGELADFVVLTSDNPRTEDPLRIIAAAERGIAASGNDRYRIVPDRREAIRRAIAHAAPGSVVLVAGKGHEEFQIVGEQRLPFSDRDEILRALGEEHDGAGSNG